jgi:hypothetical protein
MPTDDAHVLTEISYTMTADSMQKPCFVLLDLPPRQAELLRPATIRSHGSKNVRNIAKNALSRFEIPRFTLCDYHRCGAIGASMNN